MAISQNYLQKYVANRKSNGDGIGEMDQDMHIDIKRNIKEMAKVIQLELYNISRCVDAGNFHKRIENKVPIELVISQDIPCCCKIPLTGMSPPLSINLKSLSGKKPDVRIFTSYT